MGWNAEILEVGGLADYDMTNEDGTNISLIWQM